jgi:alpha-ketoglutarate-dependent taurine dioxygenase
VTAISHKPLRPRIGVEVHGIDVFFPRLELDDPQQIALARALGMIVPAYRGRSGRKSLVLGGTAAHVVGMETSSSRALIDRLQDWTTRPEFVYRHTWSPGDVVMWDNRGTMHRACAYEPTARGIMRRVELAGEETFA